MDKEKTFFIIKPESMGHYVEILFLIKKQGFNLLELKKVKPNKELLDQHYSHLVDKPFYNEMLKYLTSNEVYIGVLEKENAIDDFRKIIGATNPKEANVGTIRQMFGYVAFNGTIYNSIHGSDSKEAFEKEYSLWFK